MCLLLLCTGLCIGMEDKRDENKGERETQKDPKKGLTGANIKGKTEKKRGGPQKRRKVVCRDGKKGGRPKRAQGYVQETKKSIKGGQPKKGAHSYVPDIIISKICPKNIQPNFAQIQN